MMNLDALLFWMLIKSKFLRNRKQTCNLCAIVCHRKEQMKILCLLILTFCVCCSDTQSGQAMDSDDTDDARSEQLQETDSEQLQGTDSEQLQGTDSEQLQGTDSEQLQGTDSEQLQTTCDISDGLETGFRDTVVMFIETAPNGDANGLFFRCAPGSAFDSFLQTGELSGAISLSCFKMAECDDNDCDCAVDLFW